MMATDVLQAYDTESQIRALEVEGLNLASWEILGASNEGVKIIRELQDRLDIVRSSYRRLPVGDKDVTLKLTAMQASEAELMWLMEKLQDAPRQKEEIDKQLKILYIKLKNEIGNAQAQRSDSLIVPTKGE